MYKCKRCVGLCCRQTFSFYSSFFRTNNRANIVGISANYSNFQRYSVFLELSNTSYNVFYEYSYMCIVLSCLRRMKNTTSSERGGTGQSDKQYHFAASTDSEKKTGIRVLMSAYPVFWSERIIFLSLKAPVSQRLSL